MWALCVNLNFCLLPVPYLTFLNNTLFFGGGGIAGRLSLSLVPQKFERKEVSTEIVVYAERKIARVVWLFTGYLLVFLFYIT